MAQLKDLIVTGAARFTGPVYGIPGIPSVYGPFTVATSAWSADGSRYKAAISVSGVTANDIADVYFNADNIDSYELKPYCTTEAGTVTIYAGSIPGGSVTVEKIVV